MNTSSSLLPLEIGIVLSGQFDAADQKGANDAVRMAKNRLQDWFPSFLWTLEVARRPDWGTTETSEPTHWLLQAAEERDSKRWDLAIVITNVDLQGHYRSFAYAAVSRSLDAAVISTLRIDPDQSGMELDAVERVQRIAARLARLILHSIGHLNGLKRRSEPANLMYAGITAKDFDGIYEIDEEQSAEIVSMLEEVADVRLEERGSQRAAGNFRFIAKAIWINRTDILKAIAGARPWEFPRRLSRLTTAAVSTLAILMMTAEAWDLGLSQSGYQLVFLGFGALLVTSWYVAYRQQLLVHRFHLRMAAFVASIGVLIGALGTSFENQHHFRHIVFVDEEI